MQRPTRPIVAAAAVLSLALSACGGQDTEPPGTAPTDVGTAPDEGTVGRDESTDDLAVREAQARVTLAEQLSVDPDTGIRVVSSERVEWPSGALGCPQPNQSYTQVITPGYRILLEVDGEIYAFHGAEGQEPFLCEDPEEPAG